MRDLIKESFPEHGVFGEELGMQQPNGNSKQHLWVLDPIDGTKSFITGMSTITCIHFHPAMLAGNMGSAEL